MEKRQNLLLCAATLCTVILSSQALAKTAKDCIAEWRADKVGMQARGVTEKSYVDQCKGGTTPTVAIPEAKPSVALPAPKQERGSASGKTAKDCTAEWRADKAGMQARGVTEKAYVEQCKAGSTVPTATAPESRPTAAAPTPAPAPKQAPPVTPTAPAQPAQKPAPTTTAAPVPAPAQQSPVAKRDATLEAGQFADEASAKARCPSDTVVWVSRLQIYQDVLCRHYRAGLSHKLRSPLFCCAESR
jgi:hypothetical protein